MGGLVHLQPGGALGGWLGGRYGHPALSGSDAPLPSTAHPHLLEGSGVPFTVILRPPPPPFSCPACFEPLPPSPGRARWPLSYLRPRPCDPRPGPVPPVAQDTASSSSDQSPQSGSLRPGPCTRALLSRSRTTLHTGSLSGPQARQGLAVQSLGRESCAQIPARGTRRLLHLTLSVRTALTTSGL